MQGKWKAPFRGLRAVIREVGQLLTVGSLALAFGVACAIRGPTPLPRMAHAILEVSYSTLSKGTCVGCSAYAAELLVFADLHWTLNLVAPVQRTALDGWATSIGRVFQLHLAF